jgi:hypothetical protein
MSVRSMIVKLDARAWRQFLLIGLLLLPACRKPAKEPTPGGDSSGASVDSGKPISVLPVDNAAPPPPPPPDSSTAGGYADPVGAAASPREQPMDIGSLNTVLRNYIGATDKVPKSIEEMVKLKLLPRMPSAPPGKKLVLDTRRQEIVLQNK